jgi:hypothetical protein
VFVPGEPFRVSPKFVSKAGAYLSDSCAPR